MAPSVPADPGLDGQLHGCSVFPPTRPREFPRNPGLSYVQPLHVSALAQGLCSPSHICLETSSPFTVNTHTLSSVKLLCSVEACLLIPGLLPILLLVQDSCYERWTVKELLMLCSLSLPEGELLEGRKDLRSPEAYLRPMHRVTSQ